MLLRVIKNSVVFLITLILFLTLMPGLPPFDVEFLDHAVSSEAVKFEGPLTPNDRLDKIELLSGTIDSPSVGYLKGIESFAVHDGYLYSGVQGGDIVRLPLSDPVDKPWTVVTKVGQPCHELYDEPICGRPLGMEFDSQGRLIVADAYYGLYRINVETGSKEALVPSSLEIDGKRNLMTNSIALSRDNETIYFTTSSTNFLLTDGMYEILAAPSGRLMKYHLASKTIKVLMDEISFANGVVLSEDEDYLLVCETGEQRVWKYHLTGAKRGQKEVFATFPGAVDNIKSNGHGGYIVGIIVPTLPDRFYVLYHIRGKGLLCKLIVRLCVIIQEILKCVVQYIYPSPALMSLIHKIGNTEYMGANTMPRYALLIEVDGNGSMIRSWHSASGALDKICEGFVHDGFMYLGSPYNLYVSRVVYDQP